MTSRIFARARAMPESLRYVIAGGIAAAINWLVRFPLSVVMPFVPAVVVAALIGMLVGFITYRIFVFPGSIRPIHLQVRDFLVVNLLTLGVVTIAAMVIVNILVSFVERPLAEAIAHALAIGLGAVLNYSGHSALTFRERPVAVTVRDK